MQRLMRLQNSFVDPCIGCKSLKKEAVFLLNDARKRRRDCGRPTQSCLALADDDFSICQMFFSKGDNRKRLWLSNDNAPAQCPYPIALVMESKS